MNAQMILDSSNGLPIAIVVCLITGYLFGSFPTGYVIGRLHHMDIRDSGSGNSGTTNALRTMGKMAGLLTFVGDVAKTMIPMLIVRAVLQDNEEFASFMGLIVGFGAVLGHNFPCWLKFKGGKGFASFLGMSLGIHWKYFIVIGICIIVITLVTKYIVLATMATVISYPIYLFYDTRNWIIFAMITVLSLIIIFKHYKNLVRIAKGEEFKFKI